MNPVKAHRATTAICMLVKRYRKLFSSAVALDKEDEEASVDRSYAAAAVARMVTGEK
jgi:hypothetical protein